MNSIPCEDYVKILEEKVSSLFVYSEKNEDDSITRIYRYERQIGNKKYLSGGHGKFRSKHELLIAWLGGMIATKKYTPGDIFNILYQNIPIKSLDIFLEIISNLRISLRIKRLDIAIELTKFYEKTFNISLEEYLSKFVEIYNIFKGEILIVFLEHFKEDIILLNNSRISELWSIWRDYSGDFMNYVEWFPRELVDDLLMIQHLGKYQPSLETYIN